MPRPPGSTITAVRVTFADDNLACLHRHSLGLRAYCQCGWRSPIRRQKSLARADLRWHQVDEHGRLDDDDPEG